MSCGLRDIVRLETLGCPALLVHTDAFEEAALRQAEMLGQPAIRRSCVPHPVQQVSRSGIAAIARAAGKRVFESLSE